VGSGSAASGIDYGQDLAEKQILEKLVPRIAERFRREDWR